MNQLSVATVQQRLVEAELSRKVRWETMKKNGRLRAVGSLNDPSTKITSIKQVTIPKESERKSGTHPEFVLPAEMAGNYVDKMDRGIFRNETSGASKSKIPPVTKMKPNQTTQLKKVTPDMQKGSRKSDNGNNQLWPAAQMADHYIDNLPRGNIYSEDNSPAGGVKAPTAKNLHGTTRPKSSRKTADMTRHPVQDQPSIGEPNGKTPMPKDAPPKRSFAHVKSGVLVRVNESIKAKFDIVSTNVLKRMTENYQRFGYRVVIESSHQEPKWKSDQKFIRLIHETVAAKENQSVALYRKLGNASLNRLYQLCQPDYNNLYENREEFLKTLRIAYSHIMENAVVNYRKNLSLYIGKARVMSEGALHDIEILAEGTNHQMALRLIRNKLLEQFGLDTNIKFIFIDGTKYVVEQIREWVPSI